MKRFHTCIQAHPSGCILCCSPVLWPIPPHRLSILQRRPENIQLSQTSPVLDISQSPQFNFAISPQTSPLPETLPLVPSAASSSSPHATSDLEQARPQTSGEEELQLQLALAMSREESQKVKTTHTCSHFLRVGGHTCCVTL